MAFYKPWMIGGGVAHEVEVARQFLHDSTGGTEGISGPEHLKVEPLETPGTKVRVAPGGFRAVNRYPGGDGQSYSSWNPTQLEVPIRATGSSGKRSDLIVARILDPQYEGDAPPNVQDFDYARIEVIEGVTPRKYPLPLNLNYPAIPLARVDIPVNTGTIEDEHIVDVRSIADPKTDRQLFTHNLHTGEGVQTLSDVSPSQWPVLAEGLWLANVPEWATGARIVATWGGVRVKRSSADGDVWVILGGGGGPGPDTVRTQYQKWDGTMSASPTEEMRETWTLADTVKVPSSHRGTQQPIRMMGRKLSGGVPPALDPRTSILVDVEFFEDAV